MSIQEILKELVAQTDGGFGAMVMGYDGIPLDEYICEKAPLDLQVLSVEYATVLKEVKKAVDVLNSGVLEEMSINTDVSRVIIRILDDDLFAIAIIGADGNYGKARHLLRINAPRIRELLL